MSTTIVRYRVKPGMEEENAALVRAVYAELSSVSPPGCGYATFRDGADFVHVAFGSPPLSELAAFREFQAGLGERCSEPPRVLRDAAVGTYGL
jgi:hypothetical protein